MKKNVWIGLSLIGLVAIVCTTLVLTKPNESDFVKWMELTYDVNCLDFNCEAFKIKVKENGENNVITMQSASGGYSSGIFVMKREVNYRNFEDSSYILNIKVKGFLGGISVVDETKQLSNK